MKTSQLTMMERCADAPRRHLHQFFLANPLPEYLAQVWRDTLASTRDIEVVSLEHRDAVSRLAQDVCDSEATDP